MKRSHQNDEDETKSKQNVNTSRSSPIYLTSIYNLPEEENIDTIQLEDLIGHKELTSMWQFNFMFDLPFILKNIHKDSRPSIKSYFIYGKKPGLDDHTGNSLKAQRDECSYKENIVLDGERLMNNYATHHTKMMILFTGEGENEEVQVVIHTSNLIEFDWTNMTQGVWKSPRLKKKLIDKSSSSVGTKFGIDLLAYINKYRNPSAKKLHQILTQYDFSPIEAVFIGSAPGNYQKFDDEYGQWGIVKLQRELERIPQSPSSSSDYIIAQVSSIATLGTTDTYLTPIIGNALKGKPFFTASKDSDPSLKLIFPTVEDVSDSLEGYLSGSSIHFKRQKAGELQQLEYMLPMLHRWNAMDAGRQRCAPHIKTYMRVTDEGRRIQWFLLTSANLSKQAWGTINKTKGGHWIQSWECGVLIHSKTFHGENVSLIPVYKTNQGSSTGTNDVVYVRMPYDLAPERYKPRDIIWSPNQRYTQKDWRGNTWPLY